MSNKGTCDCLFGLCAMRIDCRHSQKDSTKTQKCFSDSQKVPKNTGSDPKAVTKASDELLMRWDEYTTRATPNDWARVVLAVAALREARHPC